MRKLFDGVLHNLDLKVAALLLAVVTWYYLATAGIEERRYVRVPVAVVNLPEDVALLSADAREVEVTLRGPRGRLDVLEGLGLVAEINLEDVAVEAGQALNRTIRLGGTNIRVAGDAERSTPLPGDVRFAGTEPAVVAMTLNRMTEKELTVQVELEGTPAQGFELKHSVSPAKVRVRGPFLLLQSLSRIFTERVAVEGISRRREATVRLQREVPTPDFGAVPIFPARPTVELTLDVVEKPAEKTIERVPVRFAAVPKNLSVIQQNVAEVAVTLRGPARRLRDIDAQSLMVEIDLEGEQPPRGKPQPKSCFLLRENVRQLAERGASLSLSHDIEMLTIEPNTVTLTLDRVLTRTLPVKAVLDGKPAEDFEVSEVTVVPERVRVRGPQSVVAALKAIETLPVQVAGVTERLRRTVRLIERVHTAQFAAVPVEPSQRLVDVVVAVAERSRRKTLKALPVHVVLTTEKVGGIRVETEPRTVGPVTFVGPQSRMEAFGPDSVLAFVRLQITSVADLRPTIRNVEFHIRDPKVHLAPNSKPLTVKLDFPPLERAPEAPKPKER